MIGEGDTGGEVDKIKGAGALGSRLWGGDVQLPAYLLCQQDFDFSVPGEGGNMPVLRVEEDGMLGAFAVEDATFVHQVADEVTALHRSIL